MTKQQIEEKLTAVGERLTNLERMRDKYHDHGMEAAVFRTEQRIQDVERERDDLHPV